MNLHHTLTRRTLTGLAGAVVALGALAGPSLTAADAAPATAPAAAQHVAARTATPTTGACYRLTKAQSAARVNPASAVPCSTKHTARTFKVIQAPPRVDLTDGVAMASFAAGKCTVALHKTVGASTGNRLLATYGQVFFGPTKKAVRDGDRRIECDLVLFQGKNALAPLPTDAVPALQGKAPYPDSVRKCATLQKGILYYTVCAAPHTYRSTTDYQLKGKYPTQQQFARAAARRCGPRIGALNPTEAEWNAGFHFSVCFKKTTK